MYTLATIFHNELLSSPYPLAPPRNGDKVVFLLDNRSVFLRILPQNGIPDCIDKIAFMPKHFSPLFYPQSILLSPYVIYPLRCEHVGTHHLST